MVWDISCFKLSAILAKKTESNYHSQKRRGRDLWPSLRLQGPAEAGFGLGIPKNVVEDPWSIKIGRHLPILAS